MNKRVIVYSFLYGLKKTPFMNKALYHISKSYIDVYNNYSYDESQNGEDRLIQNVSKMFSKDDCFIFFDVGANVGNRTKYIIQHFEHYTGHLFELSKKTFKTLTNNLDGNKNLYLNNVGLSKEKNTIQYKDFGTNFGGNTLIMEADYHKRQCNLVSGDVIKGADYCTSLKIDHIHFVKIDTEGAEMMVLEGMESLIKEQRIDIIQFEYGYTHGDVKTLMKDFFIFFQKYGYIVGRLSAEGVNFKDFSYSDNDFKSGPNYIACLPQYENDLRRFSS